MSFGQLFDIWHVHIPFWFSKTSSTAQEMKLSSKDFSCKYSQIRADLVTFTEGILNENLHFCAVLIGEKKGASTA